MVNLFTGIIFDGQSGSPMRLIQWNHTPTAVESSDRGSYLVSDYTRLGAGEKVASWRYGWFEQWFIDYLLTLSKRPENWAQTQEKDLKRQLAEQHATKARLGEELARLLKIARTSDRPPEALLVEMRELEKQRLAALESIACLEKRMDAIQAKVGSIEEERGLMAKLAHATDARSRLRLRQLIRKGVSRGSTCFPAGIPDARTLMLRHGPRGSQASGSILPMIW